MTVATEFTIYQGDTGPLLKPRPSVLPVDQVLDADWHCFIAVNDSAGSPVVASREVLDLTADSLRWMAALTPAETETLPVNLDDDSVTFDLVIEVINATTIPPFNVEKHYALCVKPQGIS